jgi:asparagine synthase (glutamine-hydrolysing)
VCGIAGFYRPLAGFSDSSARSALLEAMTDEIAHRGPDGAGKWLDPNVAFGHRRLAIIDVATGQQPLHNEDGTVTVVFNGEIYNYAQLAADLKRAGHQFRTMSDTEVIVHAWEQWGPDCVNRFRGMFAFALWDQKTKSLFMARDRLGVKPLYYANTTDQHVVFGSELKALLVHPKVNRQIRDDAVADYFALGYVPDPKSIFIDTYKLAPGHWILWTEQNPTPTITCYWRAQFNANENIDTDLAAEQLRERVSEAVQLRQISEVPLGAFLSGGVDSSAVVATMAAQTNGPVTTCSIGFNQAQFDESKYAQEVADRYKTRHFTKIVSVDDFELLEQLPRLYDEPFADSSAIPTLRVSQLAREHVTVALSGDGGDETFGGYGRYRAFMKVQQARKTIPPFVIDGLIKPLSKIYPKADWAPKVLRAKTTLSELADDPVSAYMRTVSCVRPEQRLKLFSNDFNHRLGPYEVLDQVREVVKKGPTDLLSMIQNIDYHFYLPGDINTKVDRASMAASLESREPLMDHELVDWAGTLPSKLKLKGNETKYLFKKAFEGRLSHDLLYRPKMGFSVPLATWFRAELGQIMDSDLKSVADYGAGYIDKSYVKQLLSEHKSSSDWATPLWTIHMFHGFIKNLNAVKARHDLMC